MARGLFDNPVMLLILLLIIILLFGAPKLPGMARSLGQSMRIFKSEVDDMKKDGKNKNASATTPVEGEVINNPSHGSVSSTDPVVDNHNK
ncbi:MULTISPECIES: Sec-independent protein translocase subunit TatA [unclassified Rothia (in: high G+C Gram-positive bacteria)]|uniref:Sec-independent protein translocase subunit TatA n=1 Tax=unclassified Rothia (in: high G+C Gram-positive bacteria) TaxID=2689056 RepID=UPI00195D971C|nr:MULTISPECIES: Sec-independent protein translocase subunit TatA [unclassified Rothia (in: high G+C Gram-positive bacteria)]MBM7050554.1 Sec-independent protein translocase subunit TatA [Rothia sp. ZJ1223]QRZ60746.1 Sec-independent protein translocase subunit TatA [Rothia sp. ZJ932]